METSKHFQDVIEKLATRHGIDLKEVGAHKRIEKEGYMPLVIEVIDDNQVSVAHYYTQNGDLMADPDIVFFTGYEQWVPIEITQANLGLYMRFATVTDQQRLDSVRINWMKDVAIFSNQWAQNLKDQGWLN